MNVALFGGTFDPVHVGHLAVARAARQRFRLGRVYFVPAYIPPHKFRQTITSFEHRYAMVSLATAGEKAFVPSLLESPQEQSKQGASYTINTVRRFRQTLDARDRLFFIIGIDAFLEISTWRDPVALLREVEFIVVSRPGFSLEDVAEALPDEIKPRFVQVGAPRSFSMKRAGSKAPAGPGGGHIMLPGVNIHLLDGVEENISATQIRKAAASGRSLDKLVGASVAEYIRKEGLYRTS